MIGSCKNCCKIIFMIGNVTPDFLRTFGISSLEELPPIEKINFGEPIQEIIEEPAAAQEEA